MRNAGPEQPHGDPGEDLLDEEEDPEPGPVRFVELGVVGGGLLAAAAALEDCAHLAADGDPVVERGPDPLSRQRQALARRVADEEDAGFGRVAQPMRDPVPLIADLVAAEVGGEAVGPLADVVVGS